MSTENAKNGLAIRPGRAQEDHWAPIARIPDLNQKTASTALRKPVDARSISRALSLHLVLGVTLGLLVGAALPFVFGRASGPNAPVTEPPTWFNNSGINNSHGTATLASSTLPPAWFNSSGINNSSVNNSDSKNLSQDGAVALVVSVPERGSETGSNNSGSAGSDAAALRTTAPTWLSPPSAPIDTVLLSQTLTDTTVPLSAPIATVRLPQTQTDTTVPPQSPTAQNHNTGARHDDGGGNPLRTTADRRGTSHDDYSSTWPGVASRPRPSDTPSPTPICRIPKPGVASESTTTVPPGRNSYDAATSSTH
jgi:hypothetical protein